LTGGAGEGQLLGSLFEELPLGIVLADAASGRVTHANAYAREALGVDIVGNDVVEAAEAGVRDRSGNVFPLRQSPLGRALTRGEVVANEVVELHAPDGRTLVVTTNAKPLHDAAGAIVGAFVLFEDRAMRDLRQRVEREFITNAAHELRTPLAAIASAIEVLESGAKNLPAERDMFLQHIARQSDRLQRLARALLLLARAEVHDEEPRLEIVPVKQILDDAASALTPAERVDVSVDCHDDIACLTNRDLLEQALLNVAANAARYTKAGSISLSCRAEGELAVIRVEDTGPGIAEPDLSHVFERFYRSGSRDSQGFGLGLSIARHAVEAFGGRVELESTEGKGTSVRILVPLARLVQR
jgi:two-component system phosphate regulon sensor histidine kinase PhoR